MIKSNSLLIFFFSSINFKFCLFDELFSFDEYNYFDLVREKWYTTNTSEKDYVIKDSLVATDINEYNNNYQYLYKKNKTKIIKYC